MGGGPTVDWHGLLLPGEGCGSLSHCIALGLLALGEIPHGRIVLHHGSLFDIVPGGLRMVGVGSLEKLLEVIGRLSCLALEVVLGSSDVFLIRVISLLVVVKLIIASSNCDPLGAPLWPSLTAFGASFCTFASSLAWRPLAINGDCLPIALDEDGPNCLLTGGMLGGDVK
jgi:hypothetical protein